MNLDVVKKIADAVLYEGYILYPYRASVIKNRQRFNFGTLYPRAYAELSRGSDAWSMQTECLVVGESPTLEVHVRFLHLQSRTARQLDSPTAEFSAIDDASYEPVELLRIGDETFATWQEAVEREVTLPGLPFGASAGTHCHEYSFPSSQTREPLRDRNKQVVGLLVRAQQALAGTIEVESISIGDRLFKLRVQVTNQAPRDVVAQDERDDALLRSFVSAHAILGVVDGEFVSLLEPPDEFRAAAAACQNIGVWPVLVGEEDARNLMLASPIILYDYPQIAPESSGDFFDGTEMDEMLALRVMTLTDEEKREMRSVDPRAREILERVEALRPEQWRELHGAVRDLRVSKFKP